MPVFKDGSPLTLFLLLISLTGPTPKAFGQEQSQKTSTESADEVVRIKTELVQTDLTVVDKRGLFVEGLKSEQFELRVDAKPQALAFFEQVATGSADEQKPAADGTVEAWGRASDNPVGGWYGIKKGLRGRFAMYLPPVMAVRGLAEVEHEPRNNRMRAL